MADEKEVKNEQEAQSKEEPKQQTADADEQKKDDTAKKTGQGLLTWVIMTVAIIALGGSGFVLGRLFAGSPTHAESSKQTKAAEKPKDDLTAKETQKTWYYQLDPVVANLDVPGATRYIRAVLILELDHTLDQKKGVALFEEKKPLLINWLTIYLSSLTLEDVTGSGNLRRIQSQVLDAFNEELFPDSKPMVKKILLKEFPIQ